MAKQSRNKIKDNKKKIKESAERKRRDELLARIRKHDDPTLKVVCEASSDWNENLLLAADLFDVLASTKTGVGIAAPQIGSTSRVFVVGYGGLQLPFINPTIESLSGDIITGTEGCLSYPGKYVKVDRHETVSLSYEINESGERDTKEFSGFIARIIQHEMDHLNGICKVRDD